MADDAQSRLTEALSDRYSIEREIGAGGMATVYLAEGLMLDHTLTKHSTIPKDDQP